MRIFTLTSNAYKYLTHNLLASMHRLGIGSLLHLICSDQESASYFHDLNHVHVEYVPVMKFPEAEYGTRAFEALMSNRIKIYRQKLEGGDCLFVDGDIVFLKDPVFEIASYLKDFDIVAQDNGHADCLSYKMNPGSGQNVCCGFMALAATPRLMALYKQDQFTEVNQAYKLGCKQPFNYFDDEYFVNCWLKPQVKTKILSPNGFPVGRFFLGANPVSLSDAYIAHFNWLAGNKIVEMKRLNVWFL